jgi:hypothetical protein
VRDVKQSRKTSPEPRRPQSVRITRDSDGGAPILSMRVPYAVQMHGALTSHFVGSITRRVRHGPDPPPLREPGHGFESIRAPVAVPAFSWVFHRGNARTNAPTRTRSSHGTRRTFE